MRLWPCVLALAVAGGATAARGMTADGLATYDPVSGIVRLPEVAALGRSFAVELRRQDDGRFTLQSAVETTASVAAAPALYDSTSGMLDIAKIAAASATYSARLKDIGGFRFELLQAVPVSPVSHMTAWVQTGFRASAPAQPRHVNRVVVGDGGRLVAAWYSQDNKAYMATSDDQGATWTHTALDRMLQVHLLLRLSGGVLVAAGQAFATAPVVWASRDNGSSWAAVASGLPNSSSDIAWDLAERQGEVIISTSSQANDPAASHTVIYAWNPTTGALRGLAALPGLGGLALAVSRNGTIYASTQDSAEHDDPSTAGQARIYRSTDGGASWTLTGALTGANRVYALTELSDGSIAAGTGLNGGYYRSIDGNTWLRGGSLLAGTRLTGNPPAPTAATVTRVYKILELASGALLAGTGNEAGDVQISCDMGATWLATPETGSNIVTWGLAQSNDGTLWTANGSLQGDLWTAPVPTGLPARHHYSCN